MAGGVDGISQEWWDRWWAEDWSWEGLAKKPWKGWVVPEPGAEPLPDEEYDGRGHRNLTDRFGPEAKKATLQDYWRDQANHLEMGPDGIKFTRLHLPFEWHDGTPTGKADWPSNALNALIESRLNQVDDRAFKQKPSSQVDWRAQFQGGVFPAVYLSLLDLNPRSRSERPKLAIRCDTCAFAGDASFSKAAFAGRALFDKAAFAGVALFDEAAFAGDASFDEAAFAGRAWFSKAAFAGHAAFGEAAFAGVAWFSEAAFAGHALFSKAAFAGRASFSKAAFAGHASFSKAAFAGDASFDEAAFAGRASFGEAAFAGRAWFSKAAFAGHAAFSEAAFAGRAWFSKTAFAGHALFGEAAFAGDALFDEAAFAGDAAFSKAAFADGALFGEAAFAGVARFEEAAFAGVALFSKAAFAGRASFSKAAFAGGAFFGEAAFAGRASFSEAAFAGDALFTGKGTSVTTDPIKGNLQLDQASIQRAGESRTGDLHFPEQTSWLAQRSFPDASFKQAVFLERARFDNRDFLSDTSFANAIFLRDAAFHDSKLHRGISFRDTQMKSGLERGAAFPEIELQFRSSWNAALKRLHGAEKRAAEIQNRPAPDFETWKKDFTQKRQTVEDDFSTSPEYDQSAYFGRLEDSYRTLKQHMEDKRDRGQEARFFKLELKARRKRRDRHVPWWERQASDIYGAISDFGTSIVRPLGWLIGSVFAFAILYWCMGNAYALPPTASSWGEALSYSFGRVLPFGPWVGAEPCTLPGRLMELTPPHNSPSCALQNGVDYTMRPGTPITFQLIASAQSLTAIILVFLSGLAVRRKFQIN